MYLYGLHSGNNGKATGHSHTRMDDPGSYPHLRAKRFGEECRLQLGTLAVGMPTLEPSSNEHEILERLQREIQNATDDLHRQLRELRSQMKRSEDEREFGS